MSFLIDMWVKAQLPPCQPPLLEKIISMLLPEGGHSKGKCLGNSFGTKGGVCALGSTPAAAMASHGSVVALPTLRILLCIPYTTVWRWGKLSDGSSQARRDTLLG